VAAAAEFLESPATAADTQPNETGVQNAASSVEHVRDSNASVWQIVMRLSRMTTAAECVSRGVQQRLMRHADIQTTMNVYGTLAFQEMREVHGKIVQLDGPG
jgi:hypothetical protein